MSDEAHEATPNHELERQIMSYNEAKNEREWWAMHEIERLREALRGMDDATISHVDGRDLLDELHPRHTLDIKRRVDGIETWYEGDWLSRLRDARNIARAALGEGK